MITSHRVNEVRRRAVDADDARAGVAANRVGLEPRTARHVPDVHSLVGQDIGRFHEVGVDGNRPLVVDVGLRHAGAMDLRFEQRATHRLVYL